MSRSATDPQRLVNSLTLLPRYYPERQVLCKEYVTLALLVFNEDNASAMYLFSALIRLYTYATFKQTDSDLGREPGVVEWIVLSWQGSQNNRPHDKRDTARRFTGLIIKTGERRSGRRDQVSTDTS